MSRSARFFAIALCSLSITASLCLNNLLRASSTTAVQGYGDVPSTEEIRALLESEDVRDQAWGAAWTSQGKVREFTPLLLKNLESRLPGTTWQEDAAIDATLDALIQLQAEVPLSLIEAAYDRRPAPALILLTRLPVGSLVDDFLKTLLVREANISDGLEWFAAADLLLAHRAPGIAAIILRDLRIKERILICDPGARCEFHGVGGSFFDGFGQFTQGFPAWPWYSLSLVPSRNSPSRGNAPIATVLSTGPVTIRYSRNLLPVGMRLGSFAYRRSDFQSSTPGPNTSQRLQYVAAAAPGTALPIADDASLKIEWTNRAAYRTRVANLQNDVLNRYAQMIARLEAAGALTTGEASGLKKPNIRMTVEDLRSTKTPL